MPHWLGTHPFTATVDLTKHRSQGSDMGPITTAALNTVAETTTADAQARMTELHHEYGRALLRFLGGFTTAGRLSAEDLFQETMIHVWRNLDDVPAEPEHTRRWLFTVARHVGIDAIRRAQTRPVLVNLADDVVSPSRDDTTDSVVAMESLRGAFRSLSAEHQRILAALYLEGHSLQEAAARLGVPLGTVKSRAHYALRSVRRAIAADESLAARPRRGSVRDGRRPATGPCR
ncbi:sigma-70 family RNA polymerase sigma factor [Paractinoplanes maris]|uniref:sigma-70 family RNA polymerase sigma factor n=1 Tax=Paractinoplanes maris TaxID=1734446 RepID=UPI002021AD5D|nr:sigma-70 family RNA polymerase sigma factor [Actinoplanes maris]